MFNSRPLNEEIWQYCIQDVQYLPHLWKLYWENLDEEWRQKVEQKTRLRVEVSQRPKRMIVMQKEGSEPRARCSVLVR